MKKLFLLFFLPLFLLFLNGCTKEETEYTLIQQNASSAHFADENWDSADLVRGGNLYDQWWSVNTSEEPTNTFDPLWSTQTTNLRTGSVTWRCQECHGWDYQGENGAYDQNNTHFTGFPGLLNASTTNRTLLFDAIQGIPNTDHDFSNVLSDTDVLDLTKFIVDGLIDMKQYIDYSTQEALGNPLAGQTFFDSICSTCHGSDGTSINIGGSSPPEYVGTRANEDPWKVLHKIRWGNPGTPMPSMIEEGLSLEDQVNILTYIQTLPQ